MSAFDTLELSTENSMRDLVTLTASCPYVGITWRNPQLQLQQITVAASIAPWYRTTSGASSRPAHPRQRSFRPGDPTWYPRSDHTRRRHPNKPFAYKHFLNL